MNKHILTFIGILGFCLVSPFVSAQQETGSYFNDRVFVKIHNELSLELPEFVQGQSLESWRGPEGLREIMLDFGVERLYKPFKTKTIELQKTYQIRFSGEQHPAELVKALERFEWVDFSEKIPIHTLDLTPDDLNPFQWHLDRVDAEEAWDVSTGSEGIVVAIVDDAMRYTHADLAPNLWTNTGEIPDNGIDDDNNGFVDDVIGYDVADDDNDPYPPGGSGFTHGTHVAGIVSAATDNGIGVAGMGYNVKLMAVKTKLNSSAGDPGLEATMEGVDYAISAKANVVNMSFGGTGVSGTYQSLFNAGHDQGMVFVAAAGNDGDNISQYPASYDNVISVGSTNSSDTKNGFSNYHSTVDVMAPGSGIYSTVASTDASYSFMSGTSMASPLTAGLCALMLSYNTGLTPDQVESCLESGCENIDGSNTAYVGFIGAGRINAHNSMLCLPAPISPVTDFGVKTDTICGDIAFFSDSSINAPNYWFWDFGDGSTSTDRNPQHAYASAGTYTVTLISGNSVGADSASHSFNFHFFPSFSVIAGPDTSACLGDTVDLWVTGEGVEFAWSPITGLQNSNTATPEAKLFDDVIYIVTVTDSNGCRSADSVVLSPLPSPSISAGPDQTIALGDSIQLSGSGGLDYLWTPATGLSCTNCPNPWASPEDPTLYTLNGLGANGCWGKDVVIVEVYIVGTDEPFETGKPYLYGSVPNPASDEAGIRFYLPQNERFGLSLFSLEGKSVWEFSGLGEVGENLVEMQLDEISAGIYMIRLEVDGSVLGGRMIVGR